MVVPHISPGSDAAAATAGRPSSGTRDRPLAAAMRVAAAAFLLFLFLFPVVPAAHARATPDALPGVVLTSLPPEAREVYAQIRKGGPFRYDRDGVVFGNRERLLPAKSRGYYREYTVPTPGAKNRGARRIVCGGEPRAPDACYYTDDHYQSFRRIRE
jgi:ribonuclease T1